MNEVKVYGALLAVLMVGSYVSWTRDDTPRATEGVAIADHAKDAVSTLTFVSRTATVSLSFKKDEKGTSYPWFEVEQGNKKRGFTGGERTDKLVESFAPFKGLRSLGKLTGAELGETKLERPEGKLVIGLRNGSMTYDLGGRTSGARDWYVRERGGAEVYLVGSSVIGDLEGAEQRFMERRIHPGALKDVSKVVLTAGGKTRTVLHKNRLAGAEAFWASDAKPDEKSETLANFIDKLDKLSVAEYPPDGEPFPRQGTPVLNVTWYGDDDKTVTANVEVWRVGEGKDANYYGLSELTHVPTRLQKYSAEQIERDLASVLSN